MSHQVELYSAAVCPFAQKTEMLLLIKNIHYKRLEIDLDNKPDWFAQVSPFGKVPLIKHNDHYIYESDIINEYLNEVYPIPNLLSDDSYLRAQMRIWISYLNSEFVPVYYKLLLSQDKPKYDELRDKLTKVLHYIENEGFARHSGSGPYFFGDTISLVDISFYPFFERFVANEYYRNAKIPQECNQLRQWIRHMRTLPAIIKTANPPEFYIKRYAKYADGSTGRVGAKKIIDDLWA